MKKTTYALAATVAALGVSPALSADLGRMPTKAPYYAPAPAAMLWNGFYIGAQIGYGWGRDRSREFVTATGVGTGINPGFGTDGFLGGVHAGYNYQMGGMVLGLEGDFEGSDVSGGARVLAPFTSSAFDSRWQGSLRGRVGAAFGPSLLYVTGGAAFADLRYAYQVGAGPVETFNRTKTGWTLGAGAEYAISPNWSTRLEYRYTDFGSVTNASVVAAPGFSYQQDPSFHTVRLGVSYRFGGMY
jgi:outer membrane immunogenic protein